MHDIESLPRVYHDAETGEQIADPVYRLISPCFLGKPGKPPSYFEENAEVVWDGQPNSEMEPRNRAAAIAFADWQKSLPPAGVALNAMDLMEAANLLRQQAGDEVLPHEVWQGRVFDLARELKSQREGIRMAPLAQRSTPAASAPPMSAGNFKTLTHRSEDVTGIPVANRAARRVRPTAPPMATEPRPPAGDAVER
jgi:hypothetical protein